MGSVRHPGGSVADVYPGQTGTEEGGGHLAPGTGFGTFMGTTRAAGAQPTITVNYGTGMPQEAASWVQYANVTKHYGVKYGEVGNEQYGNGEYGPPRETGHHSSHGAPTHPRHVRHLPPSKELPNADVKPLP
ncbi:hypothetical protein GCM10010300_63760 [Streptomyces olivaceoviridis]|uniref:hypothetical protein n=1 Tax=Streptomyces olivaceoviridis TaxID=1921 RepID=UPI001674723B|nr:hypothetical protein [Streptomyces olivaceoviridis]GGZ11025.1 hypothetical protein GCM10010300_63760 [Streptomyces olivaceoviridis]